jgi:hypothetical protein
VEFLCGNLENDGRNEKDAKNYCADKVAEVHGHRNRVPAGFAERRRKDFDKPED